MTDDSLAATITALRADAAPELRPLLDAMLANGLDEAGIEEAWQRILEETLGEA